MFEEHGSVTLKNGESVSVGVVVAPDTEWTERVQVLLQHKGDPWNWQNQEILQKNLGFDVRFYLLHRQGLPFANILIASWKGAGILAHVWTKPEDRRQGAAKVLMEVSLADFASHGGEALFLGTGFDSPPYHLYFQHGFRPVEEKSGRMAWYRHSKSVFESQIFTPQPTRIEPLAWKHWPGCVAFGFSDFPQIVRSIALELFGRNSIERSFLQLLRESQRRQVKGESGRGVVLVGNANDSVVDFAVSGSHRLWSHTSVIDLCCHPSFWSEAPALLSSLPFPNADRHLAYCDAENVEKHEALLKNGFVIVNRFHQRVRKDPQGTSFLDVVEFEKK